VIDPNDYWVNNPLITPVNKALMYDNDIDGAVSAERERIIKLLEGDDGQKIMCLKCSDEIVALIKGENKTNPWTSRPLTEEDEEHYGLEGENK
jgi:hypothetical protein